MGDSTLFTVRNPTSVVLPTFFLERMRWMIIFAYDNDEAKEV
jgi:hypothetical protein